jgi:hypothetical protein
MKSMQFYLKNKPLKPKPEKESQSLPKPHEEQQPGPMLHP